MIRLTVDGIRIQAKEGGSVLEACIENGIYVPNLCFLESMEPPPGSCRLCFVEIEGERGPVSSCRVKARDGMVVNTRTPAARELQRAALELLLSNHRVECKSCPANRKCALRNIAGFLGVPLKSKQIDRLDLRPGKDMGHPLLARDAGRCVLCGRCIFVCGRQNGSSILAFTGRGFDTVVGYLGENEAPELPCLSCLACVAACPVGAIRLNEPASTGSGAEITSPGRI